MIRSEASSVSLSAREGGARYVGPVLEPEACYRALLTRDERFDGRIFVGVTSTGIYCRPVCPAGPAKLENCRFFPSAAAAQTAGFRPCLRCRPESAPERWFASGTVTRGLALIAEGALDGDDASVGALAERLGIGERQLRRLFQQHLGASPIAVAQTRRVLFAKQLLHETELSMTDVALAAGFGSVRRFNEVFRTLFRRPPSALRRGAARGATGVTVRLRHRGPLDWSQLSAFFSARAIDGVERVEAGRYARVLRHGDAVASVDLCHEPQHQRVAATIKSSCVRLLPSIVAQVRQVLDLGADVTAINAHLAADPLLRPLIAARPGLRVPGGWGGFEVAVRAVLGQQISVAAARRLGGALVALCGRELATPLGAGLTHTFPDADAILAADLGALGMPNARKKTLVALAEAARGDASLFMPRDTLDDTVVRLRAIAGIGEWTAQYIALRASRHPDAFPASDVGLLRGVGRITATRPTAAELTRRAERWRPWRAYAAQHLWAVAAAAKRIGEP